MDMPLDVAEMNEQNMSDFGSLGMSGFVPSLEKGQPLVAVLVCSADWLRWHFLQQDLF